jgi:hypothetical protein
VQATAAELGLPVIRVRSNLDSFFSSVLNFQATNTTRNAAVALLFQAGSKRFLYASSYPWHLIRIDEAEHMARLDPVLLPGLSTERIELAAAGTDYTRIQKIARIAHLDLVQRRLDVCVVDGRNCSRCWKCMRTMFTLELLGHLQSFERVFDLEAYRQERAGYLRRVWAEAEHAGTIDVRKFAIAHDVRPSLPARAVALMRRSIRMVHGSIRARLRPTWRRLPEPTRRRITPLVHALHSVVNR